ncbi:aminopeptidase P family protein [bacterium]|nr:MAG: aminopeptidase P family protein [bacterium]
MGIFSPAEMRRRLTAFDAALEERHINVALVHTADNVYYFSGVPLLSEWGRPMWVVVDPSAGSSIVGASIETENMAAYSAISRVISYADDERSVDACLHHVMSAVGGMRDAAIRFGIERSAMTLALYEALRASLPKATFVDVGEIIAGLRLIKSAEEIEILELGGTVAKIGANAFLQALTDNVPELTVAGYAVAEMDRALAALSPGGATSTYAYAQFGEHTLTPHLHPTGKRLRRGDLVALNVFPTIWGYCVELERTFVFGAATAEQQSALDAVNEAFDAGKEAVRPGVSMGEIDVLTRRMLEKRNYGAYIRHGAGHAHGIMIGAASREEGGELRAYNAGRLQPNMANSVEPGVYVPNLGGFRHSDVLIVTDNGARCITEFPRDIAYARA